MLDVDETDHDVGHLDAGVVDVVLHLDRNALGAQPPHQQVAEHGVPQVADVGRLVRIDVGVLDDDLARLRRPRRPRRRLGEDRGGEQAGGELRAVEEEVQITGPLDPKLAHPGRQAPPGGERRRNVARL